MSRSRSLLNKLAYFQGGGGPNEPTPGRKKYRSDKAIVDQTRFVEPFYHNYDYLDSCEVSGLHHVPGSGYVHMEDFDNTKDFVADRKEIFDGKYESTDLWIEDTPANYKERVKRMKIRAQRLNELCKLGNHTPEKEIINIIRQDENDGPNFDYGDGAYTAMSEGKKMKTITDAPHNSPGALMVDDNEDHMMPPKEHGTSIYDWRNSPYQGTPGPKKKDVNHIDFPLDSEVNHYNDIIYPGEENYQNPHYLVGPEGPPGDVSTFPSAVGPMDHSSYINSAQIAGEHSYLPMSDFEDRSDEALDFGRDYTENAEFPGVLNEDDLQRLTHKYLEPSETDLFGLPDGMDPISDLDPEETEQVEQPYDTVSDTGRQMYEDKWNI